MSIGRITAALLAAAMLATGAASAQVPDPQPTPPRVEDLGEQRYRVGAITIDKAAGSFTVAGRILELADATAPLEFMVAARDGMKAYESLIEVDAMGIEVNLACILIGLTARPDAQPRVHFDPEPVDGDRVRVTISWQAPDGSERREPASRMLAMPDGPAIRDEWVYTGSRFNGPVFAAQEVGTLVGFVHDTDSIIQHSTGLGLGNYGAVLMNTDVVPPAGTPVTLEIARIK